MTAVAGYWSLGGSAEPAASCARMLHAQAMYASDPPALWHDGPLALGRALYRTLPEDAADPGVAIGGGGRWILVADVRLDDREGLCAAIGIASTDARMLADATIVMRAVERWEAAAIDRLVGDFALALWDRDRARLTLARDFMGQRPLHFHRGSDFVAFASMSKGVHAVGVSRAPNERMIAEYLTMSPGDSSDSYFAGIERILPGEIRTITPTGTATARHWSFSPQPPLRSANDYVNAVREVFDRAVSARLRGTDGRVAAHLSGGLDSGAVVASAAGQIGTGRVTAFTAVPVEGFVAPVKRGRFIDEGAHAAAVAAMYPAIEHVLIRAGQRSPVANLDRNFDLYGRPTPNLCNAAWLDAINDEAAARGLRVLLTGQLGNLTFSYRAPDQQSDPFSIDRLVTDVRYAVRLHRQGLPLMGAARHVIARVAPQSVRRYIAELLGRRQVRRQIALVDPVMAARLRQDMKARATRAPADDPTHRRLAVMATIDPGNFNKGTLAGWGIDRRDPTADRRLVELCLSIPPQHYLADGRPRAIARLAFAGRLPSQVLDEPGKGLQAADWHIGLRTAWSDIEDEVDRIASATPPITIVDVRRLRALLAEPPTDGWDTRTTELLYRHALLRAVSAGNFLRKASAD